MSEHSGQFSHLINTKIYMIMDSRPDFKQKGYNNKLILLEKYLINEYPKIEFYFGNYTKHDWSHTLNVLQYMFDLVIMPEKLKTETLMLIVFCALLHDIGMAFDGDNIKELQVVDPELKDEMIQNKEQTQVYLRNNHGKLASFKIQKFKEIGDYKKVLTLSVGCVDDDFDYSEYVAKICESHDHSMRWLLEELDNNREFVFVACLLRLADLLDIDGKRANYYYELSHKPEGDSLSHFTFNQALGGIDKIVNCAGESCDPNCPRREKGCGKKSQKVQLQITVPAELSVSDEAKIWRMISDYSDEIQQEIRSVNNILNSIGEPYCTSLISSVEVKNNVPTPNYRSQISTYKINIDYPAIRRFLYGNHLYPEPIYGIREIVQNCYDACKSFLLLATERVGWSATIVLRYDLSLNTFSIIDSGIGMTDYVIKEYFLNIGRSIYSYDVENIDIQHLSDHIGYFGLGFYAVFMLVNSASITTKSYKEGNIVRKIEIDKSINYATLIIQRDECREHGTEVKFQMQEIMNSLKCNNEHTCCELICDYIRRTFLSDNITIQYEEIEEGRVKKNEIIELNNLCSMNEYEDVSEFLFGIQAKVKIGIRKTDSLFIVEIIDNNPKIQPVSYDDLLDYLRTKMSISRQIPFMNLGDFNLFTADEELLKKWTNIVNEQDGRINYTSWSQIQGGITINLGEFCEKYKFAKPTHCDVLMLQLLINGRNVALCKEKVLCSEYSDCMLKFDACGEPQLTDRVFLRNVSLPKVHVTIPWLNYRYQFNALYVNIKTSGVFPILTRDDLTNQQKRDLNYALGYSISSMPRNGIENAENELIISEYYLNMKNDNIFIRRSE